MLPNILNMVDNMIIYRKVNLITSAVTGHVHTQGARSQWGEHQEGTLGTTLEAIITGPIRKNKNHLRTQRKLAKITVPSFPLPLYYSGSVCLKAGIGAKR